MTPTLVQVHVMLNGPRATYEAATAPVAQLVMNSAGLQWKIWWLDEAEQEAGGILLFADQPSAQAYLSGPAVAHMQRLPLINHFRARQFMILAALTAATWGPVEGNAVGL